jgi:hypothetical protein
MSAQESQQKRLKVCGEILETEKTYLDQLSTMVGAYDKVMQLQRIGSELDRKTLFQDIETLHGLHLDFYKKLEARVSPSLKKSGYYTLLVGDLFSEFSAMLPMYSAFIDSFEERSRCLDRIIQKNAKAFKVLEDDVKSKGLNNGLHNLLITPVQRLPRYLLLLNSLRECTLDDHKDYQLLKTACTVRALLPCCLLFQCFFLLKETSSFVRTNQSTQTRERKQRAPDCSSSLFFL